MMKSLHNELKALEISMWSQTWRNSKCFLKYDKCEMKDDNPENVE